MPIDAFAALNAMVRAEVARTDLSEHPCEDPAEPEQAPATATTNGEVRPAANGSPG
ncbi:hypothetical protein V1460_13770 [Streptomyces sp. SCSIO 30461]|uniref:hypothetical protein n=1 Tax=Streptomyces sp. SCSIO 30461 TaxID=3118085 RepID=UPI0030D5EDF8